MGTLDLLNIGLDTYSVILCLMLGINALLERDVRLRSMNRCFAGMCLSNAVMALGDMTSWVVTPLADSMQYSVVVAGSFMFYFAVVPIYVFFTGYIVSYFNLRSRRNVPKTLREEIRADLAIYALPCLVATLYLAVCVASLATGWLFAVTMEGGYARGSVFWISQVVVIVLHLYNTGIILSRAKQMNVQERLAFACWVLLPAIANFVQVFSFGIALLNQSITISLLIIFIGIQSERRTLLAKRDEELAELHAAMMLSQIQPHFLYNALAAIRELCRKSPDEAVEMVTNFAAYLRENMHSMTSREPIAFERELDHTKTYLMLEARRYGERLHWELDIRAQDFVLPPLSVQPLVENAVRHGLAPREEGGTVRVRSFAHGEQRVVVVEDDGVGFDVSTCFDSSHVGITNVRERVRTMCGGTLDLESTPGGLTRAVLTVPCAYDPLGKEA